MSSNSTATHKDAQLLLGLSELRKDRRMQEAWDWFETSFFPQSVGDIEAVLDPAHPNHADFGMVTAYWEMASSFVVHGVLNAELFFEWAGEMTSMWARIGRFVERLRRNIVSPGFLINVEKAINVSPAEVERVSLLLQANRKRRVINEARAYLPSGWACSERDQAAILRDYEAVCLHTQLGMASICNLEIAARHVIEKKLRGSFVECGTWRGGGIAYWARSFIRNGGDDSVTNILGFDSFEGMPRMTQADGEKASQWLYGKRLSEVEKPLTDGALVPTGANLASEDECRAIVEGTGYHKDSIHIVKGWFQDTLPGYKQRIGPIAVLRLDADFYEATMFCLQTLYDSVLSGGLVIIDDYEWFDGCRRAVDEFMARRDPQVDLIYFGDVGRFFFKP